MATTLGDAQVTVKLDLSDARDELDRLDVPDSDLGPGRPGPPRKPATTGEPEDDGGSGTGTSIVAGAIAPRVSGVLQNIVAPVALTKLVAEMAPFLAPIVERVTLDTLDRFGVPRLISEPVAGAQRFATETLFQTVKELELTVTAILAGITAAKDTAFAQAVAQGQVDLGEALQAGLVERSVREALGELDIARTRFQRERLGQTVADAIAQDGEERLSAAFAATITGSSQQ